MDPFAVSEEHLMKYSKFHRQEEFNHECERLEVLVGPSIRSSALHWHLQILKTFSFFLSDSFQNVKEGTNGCE